MGAGAEGLGELARAHPEHAGALGEIGELLEKRLWHPMMLAVEQLAADCRGAGAGAAGGGEGAEVLVALYRLVLAPAADKVRA